MPSRRVVASYILDWIVIAVIAAAGGGLSFVKPVHRPFSLLDLSISYPLVPSSISTVTLVCVALLAPGIVIVLSTLILVPGPDGRRNLKNAQAVRRKLWELYAGLTGLALSIALGFLITQGLKNIVGKPRPHLIALCQPDLTNVTSYVVGGGGQDISVRWTLVSSRICTLPDRVTLNDGFRSFPSGHASFSWGGLLYLVLFISSKFSIAIPYLPRVSVRPEMQRFHDIELVPLRRPEESSSSKDPPQPPQQQTIQPTQAPLPLYNQAATPPTYGLLFIIIPIGAAAYITSTRYTEFWHFGADVLAGSVIGIGSAWFSFRWYHLPIRRGHGWAWGPRTRDRAFAIGVGVDSYVGSEGWESSRTGVSTGFEGSGRGRPAESMV